MSDFALEDVNQPLKHAAEKIPNNYQKYLSDSKMRNQKLRELNEREQKRSKFGNREEGFSLYFSGANSETGADTKIKLTSIAPRKSKTSEEHNSKLEERGKTAPSRKRWQSPTKIGFLTERGDKIFARPNDYYSEDFVEEDGIEETVDEEIEEEIIGDIRMDLSIDDVRALRQSLVVRERQIGLCTIKESTTPNVLEEPILAKNDDYSDNRLKQIVDRVVQLSADQQKRLLASLAKIEENCEDAKDTLSLSLVIESNWGHESRVGLTEIAFWTATKEPIKIQSVSIGSEVRNSTKITAIVDGKRDTAKERHMWSSDLFGNEPVRINCVLEASSANEVRFIAVWNYNKSLDTLSTGVRSVSVWAGDSLLLRGTVERALGNAAFNPPTVLPVVNESQSELKLDNDLELSSDDECLLDKLRQAQNKTFRSDEATARRGSARFGRRSEMDDREDRDQLKELVEQFEKATLVSKKVHPSLEKSWTSLSHFDVSHAGRVSYECRDPSESSTVRLSPTEDDFVIPELPEGRVLVMNIRTTWGDPHYVGLTGIEMFAATGERLKPKAISADPADVNVLPGYGDDPRVIANLLDGVNKTRDDVHMWLAPFTAGRDHLVTVEFAEVVRLALLRVWNYNKSRIHSSRGAKDVEVTLDGAAIFRGEICRASEDGGEVILFTSDDAILDAVGQNDDEYPGLDDLGDSGDCDEPSELLASLALRPTTAKQTADVDQSVPFRPFTAVKGLTTLPAATAHSTVTNAVTEGFVRLEIVATWSDHFYVGLAGVELVDDTGLVMPVDRDRVTSTVTAMPGDPRTVDKIFDEVNLTTDDSHMWLAPFCADDGSEHSVTITVPRAQRLAALRIWNYNKSPEDSYRGVKILHVWLDGKRVSPDAGYLLRRAPGHTLYDFVQEITLGQAAAAEGDRLDSRLPCGFVYQLSVFGAWADPYYVGLNGMELFDERGRRIEVAPHRVYACPDSVNALTPRSERGVGLQDVRTPDKLVDGHNDTDDPRHMWLAPILPGLVNKLFIVFDRPVALAMIRLWNYSKTPTRGAKDFAVLVDDLLIYSGVLPAAACAGLARGILPRMSDVVPATQTHRTVLFDLGNAALVAQERGHVLEAATAVGGGSPLDVVLTDDGGHDHKDRRGTTPNQRFRPTTSVNRDKEKLKTNG